MSDKYSNRQYQNDDCGCKDAGTGTKTEESVKKERDKLCLDLYSSAGVVVQYEKKVDQLKIMENYKTCSFLWSEEFYYYYRDLSLSYGSKLLQSTESIKDGIKNNSTSGKQLSDTLDAITKSVKDIKTKILDLNEAANKLQSSANDSCNCAAMAIITGKKPAGCTDKTPPVDTGKGCPGAEDTFKKLIGDPYKLVHEVDGLVKSSHDVVGIQAFSIVQMDKLQGELNAGAKQLDGHIQDAVKKGEAAVKKTYEELGKIAQELSKAVVDKYAKRSVFEGLFDASRNLCCNPCDCLKDKSCGDKICEICKEILPDPKPAQQTQAY
ncbi:MAG: hypothetical protein KF746_20995 [Chitinophagaceae bacterium]|nr:hypothetical protein [Chitinophagaceae bacterium]